VQIPGYLKFPRIQIMLIDASPELVALLPPFTTLKNAFNRRFGSEFFALRKKQSAVAQIAQCRN
jgi:hypothetical protein